MKSWLVLILSVALSACGGSDSMSSSSLSDDNESAPMSDPATFKLTCEEAQFVKLLNMYRVSLGYGSLVVSKASTIAGRWHAQDMIDKNYFAHIEPSGRNHSQRGQAFGAYLLGENIAAGNNLATKTFCQWKNSPGHHANMISTTYKSTGIGLVAGGYYRFYWSSNFGSAVVDALVEPLTLDLGCTIPTALPTCP
jgi:uncharacterized protein YkwD